MEWTVNFGDKSHTVGLPDVIPNNTEFLVTLNGRSCLAKWQRETRTLFVQDASDNNCWKSIYTRTKSVTRFQGESDTLVTLEFTPPQASSTTCVEATITASLLGLEGHRGQTSSKPKVVRSQITGKVLKILVKSGDTVAAGDTLMIIEAMKMENRILATSAGIVESLSCSENAMVSVGAELVRLK